MATGKTKVFPSGTRVRAGTTPGGRQYSSQRWVDPKIGAVSKSTVVRSKGTVWDKQTSKHSADHATSVVKHRSTGGPYSSQAKTYSGVKGPTKPKPSWGKTHETKSGAKIRTGKTPGGRKYSAVRSTEESGGVSTVHQSVRVGSKSKYSQSKKAYGHTVSKASNKYDRDFKVIDAGQKKPKGGK